MIEMTSRKQVQDAHEDDVIRQFIAWLNSTTSSHFRVAARPDPPNAVLCDECCSRWVWVEHADIYRSGDEAHEERSLAVAGEKDYFHKEHPIVEPDLRLATHFVEIFGDKLQKYLMLAYLKPMARGFSFLRREILYLPGQLLSAFKKN